MSESKEVKEIDNDEQATELKKWIDLFNLVPPLKKLCPNNNNPKKLHEVIWEHLEEKEQQRLTAQYEIITLKELIHQPIRKKTNALHSMTCLILKRIKHVHQQEYNHAFKIKQKELRKERNKKLEKDVLLQEWKKEYGKLAGLELKQKINEMLEKIETLFPSWLDKKEYSFTKTLHLNDYSDCDSDSDKHSKPKKNMEESEEDNDDTLEKEAM